MEGSDETGVMQRIQSSFGNCSSSLHKQRNYAVINGQMQNLTVIDANNGGSTSVKRPSGIPPSHPHSHFACPKLGPGDVAQNLGAGPSGPAHSRSLSQSSFFSFHQLPPLSPSVFRESSGPVSGSSEVSMDEKDGSFRGGSGVHVSEGLPPRRGHRRSSSDVPLGFASIGQAPMPQKDMDKDKDKPAQLVLKREADWGLPGEGGSDRKSDGEVVDDLFSAYMSLDNLEVFNSSSLDDKDMDSRASGTRTNDSSENEVESAIAGNSCGNGKRGKRNAPGDIVPTARHYRSLSMDSFMGSMNFGDESPRLPPSPGIRSAQHSPSNSFDENSNKFSLEFANGEFSPAELKKIMASDKLAELAMSDPKRVKRILANRQSAARSKERKLRYIAELEHKVQTLQSEATTLSAQLTLLQRDSAGLTTQNNELRFRLQAMEQQAQLRDALNEALTAEVQRLKLVSAEQRGDAPNRLPQQVMSNNHVLQLQSSQYNMHQLQQNNQKQQEAPCQQQSPEPQQSLSTRSQKEAEASKS